jgi:hypothetical protein
MNVAPSGGQIEFRLQFSFIKAPRQAELFCALNSSVPLHRDVGQVVDRHRQGALALVQAIEVFAHRLIA